MFYLIPQIEASQQVKKRMSRSLQAVDNTFLKSLPKSKLYQVSLDKIMYKLSG